MTTNPLPYPEDQIDTAAIASSVIYEMLGRRLTWPVMRAVDAYPVADTVILTGRPVVAVVSVTDPDGVDITADCDQSGFRIRLPNHTVWRWAPSGNRYHSSRAYTNSYFGEWYEQRRPYEVIVTYTFGHDTPPAAIQYAIDEYKKQLDLAIAGDSSCQLPKRVTSISRQGMSMTILDPAEYLDKGHTGLPQIDAMVVAMNPTGAKRRARLFTQHNPPARRISVEPASMTTDNWSAGEIQAVERPNPPSN